MTGDGGHDVVLGRRVFATPDPSGLTVALPLTRIQPCVRSCLGVLASPYPPALSLEAGAHAVTVAHGNAAAAAQHLFAAPSSPCPDLGGRRGGATVET